MNDFSELRYATDLIKKVLSEERDRAGSELLRGFLAKAESAFGELGGYSVYACCFSEDGDQLSQWRAYAKAGAGYSIGFNSYRLQSSQENTFYSSILVKVIYDQNVQRGTLQETINTFCRYIEEHAGMEPSKLSEGVHGLVYVLRTHLFEYLFLFKDEVFREEKEWRAVLTAFSIDNTSDLRFREGQGSIVPYVAMNFPNSANDARLPISKVIQGPQIAPQIGEIGLRLLLKKYGYPETIVHRSRVPIRF
jgi:hypothetical protein